MDPKNIASVAECYRYWLEPNEQNKPEAYLLPKCNERSKLLVNLIHKHVQNSQAKIFEIGFNSGRNLNFLYNAGYRNLWGVEINPIAIQMFRDKFPKVAKSTHAYTAPVEGIIKEFNTNYFDVIFSIATLQQVPYKWNWIFSEIKRITKYYLITIEDEQCCRKTHFPRDYKEIFEKREMQQLEEHNCENIEGLNKGIIARVFKKL